MDKRNDIQNEALDIALRHKRATIALSMGVGKTLVGLKYIEHFQDLNMKKLNILIVAPKLSIFESWKNDSIKFNISLENVKFTTYLSLVKQDPNNFDIVIFDECHSLLNTHLSFLKKYNNKILGLTGTPSKYKNSEKGILIDTYCPVVYKYITDEAVNDKILNNYKIIVHRMELSSKNNLLVNLKNKKFYTSELKNYQYWTQRIASATTKKQEQLASIMRMKAMMDYRTKVEYTKELLFDIDDKCIVFVNTQEQADSICYYSYHSNNPNSEENLEKFKRDEISELSCVAQLNEGINIPNLKSGIILHSYGNERKANQRIGRLLRLDPEDLSVIHILCYKNTIDEKWTIKALEDFDQTKIKYFDV